MHCHCLPPNHNIHIFTKGISSLSQVTGQEHDQICHFLLGLIIDIQLPDNISNVQFICSACALLDLLRLAKYPIHSNSTLQLLTDALACFHTNRDIFINLGIRTQFNLPKLHYMSHYVELVKYFGTTDNFDTQYTERLHIDIPKYSYGATNHKDEYEQMTCWLDWKERVLQHEQYIQWQQAGTCAPTCVDREPPSLDTCWELSMTKHPSMTAVPLNRLQDAYGAPLFKVTLQRFISTTNDGNQTRQQLERSLWRIHLPFNQLPVWHVIKFMRSDPLTGTHSTADSIHIKPAYHDKRQ